MAGQDQGGDGRGQVKAVAAKYLGVDHSVTGYLLPAEPVQN